MDNKIKKFLAIFLILSLMNGMFAFADSKFISNMNIIELKNIETGEFINNFSIGDIIKTYDDGIMFNYNDKLKINIFKKSDLRLDNFNSGELLNGKVKVSSISDYSINIGDIKVDLKDSGAFFLKDDLGLKILSDYGINIIHFNGKKYFLLAGNQAIIMGDKIIFDKKNINSDKIYLEDKKFIFTTFGGGDRISNFFSDFVYFNDKKSENEDFFKKNIFNSCVDAISDLVEKEKGGADNVLKFYSNLKKKCINEEVLGNEKFLKRLDKNIENISSLKVQYFIIDEKKKFLGQKFSFIENIFYLQKNISSGDLKNFPYFLDNTEKSFSNEDNLENLKNGYILIDGILKNNLKFSFEKIYDFRKNISMKILSKTSNENFISEIKNIISVDSKFVENLLEKKSYKELDYIFLNRPVYDNKENNEELNLVIFDYNKAFDDYLKILDLSKNILHGSFQNGKKIEDIKKEEAEKQKKEAEIKVLLDSFEADKVEDVKVSIFKQKEQIIKIFKDYGFNLEGKNIEGFMEGGSMFYVNGVEFLLKKYDLVFDLSTNIVSKMKSLDGDMFDGNGSMDLLQFKNLILTKNFKASVFDDQPSPDLQNIEEKDFSHEIFLKRELVRKYLGSVGVEVGADGISNVSGDTFNIINSKVGEYGELNMGFNLKLIKWTVSNLSFGEDFVHKNSDKDSYKNFRKNIKRIKLAKNLKSKIGKFYSDFLLRENNLVKIISDLAGLGINLDDVSIGEASVDGFDIQKSVRMSSGDGVLLGKYFVGTGLFKSARFELLDNIEDFKNISVEDLIEKIKFTNDNIEELEALKAKEEVEKAHREEMLRKTRILNYGEGVPDELLNGDWITD